MMKKYYDAVVIGAGCAGLAAAVALKKNGIEDVLLLEKDEETGGILNQCIHNGFGLSAFGEQMSGPAFAQRFYEQAVSQGVIFRTGVMVTKIFPDKTIVCSSMQDGVVTLQAGVIILAVGCYERNSGAIAIPGDRPAGVYTAGQAQKYLNMDGMMVGNRVFILGSGDIGLIMARRMRLEGAEVLGVAEVMPYSNGLPRNIQQCLIDYDIPLYLSHTVTGIHGKTRLTGIDLSQVDENRNPIPGSTKRIECDTLLLSVGLIPENHLGDACGIPMDPAIKGPRVDESYMTEIPGIFACGNGLHVHDLADYAAHQGTMAGNGAAAYLKNGENLSHKISVVAGNQVGYVVPSYVHTENVMKTAELYFRVKQPMEHVEIVIRSGEKVIRRMKKDHVIPSEMEMVIIAGKMLEGLQDDLIVEVHA